MKTNSLKMKLLIIITLILMVASIAATVVVSMPQTFAVWTGGTGQSHDGEKITTDVESIWGKYFIYSKNIDNTYSIVGYKKGCVNAEMIIPKTVPIGAVIRDDKGNEVANATANLAVTKIKNTLNSDGQLGYVIKQLIIHENITEIEAYTFCMMDELKSVDFYSNSTTQTTVTLGDFAFKSCDKLTNAKYDAKIILNNTNAAFDITPTQR